MTYKYPLVVVHWDDAVDRGDGESTPVHKPARQICLGWLLQYDSAGVSIAYEYSEEDDRWRNETFIPSGMIVAIDFVEDT